MIDAWRIGVSIAMTSNANQILGVLGRDLAGLGQQAKALTGTLNLAKLAAVGAMGVVAGGAALAGMAKLVSHGQELVHQQALMRSAGMDNKEIAEATTKAWQNTRDVMGTGVSENLKNIRELRMVFGDTTEAMANLQNVTKAQVVLNAVRGAGAGDQVFAIAKALEVKGVSMDPAHFTALLDAMTKAITASGGKVLGTDFFTAFKYGRTATQGWDDKFVGTILPTLIQEMKGGGGGGQGGPGNALQSAFQAVVGGVMSNKAANEFVRLGLVDPHKIIRTSTGNVKGVGPGGVRGASDFQTDPYEWVQRYLVPALKAKGITTPEAIRDEVSHMFANRTAQQMMTMFATQQTRFEKDATLIRGAQGLGAYDDLQKTDPATQMKNFTAAWQNLLTALGAPLVEPAYKMLIALTAALNGITKWASEHQETVKLLGEAFAGLGVALLTVGVGTVAFAALTALGGPLGVIALVGVAAAVTAANLGALEKAIQNLLPDWLKAKPGADGKMPLESLKAHPMVMPWWMPLPAGPGGREDTPAWLNFNRRLHRGQPGYDENGDSLVHKESWVPSSGTGGPRVQTTTYIQLDGRTIAKAVSEEQARQFSRPLSGTSAFDGRISAPSPGQQVAAWA